MEKHTTHTDDFILRLLKKNDSRAMAILYNLYAADIYHTAICIIGEKAPAEDMVHEVIMIIWKKRTHLHLKNPLKPYLRKMTANRSLNYLRNKKDGYPVDEDELPETTHINQEGERQLEGDELRHLIRVMKRQLPPRTRVAFILSRSLKMSNQEIADQMGISQKGVEKHITKALKIFQKMKNDYLKILFPVFLSMYEKWTDLFFWR